MAYTWEGKAPRVNQITKWTISSNTNTHTFILSAANPAGTPTAAVTFLTVTADGALTTTQLAAAVVTAFNLLKHPWALAVTCTSDTNIVTFTANVAGVPFVFSKTGTGTSTLTTTTANSGPNDWSVPGNWKEGAIPTSTSYIYISGDVPILYGLAQSAVTGNYVDVNGYSADIGTLGTPLQLGITELDFDGFGSAWFDLASGTYGAVNIHNSVAGDGRGVFFDLGTITALNVWGGSVWLNNNQEGNTVITTISIYGGSVLKKNGGAVTTVNQDGGTFVNESGATTITINGGSMVNPINTTFGPTTLTMNGGFLSVGGANGTIGTFNLNGGIADLIPTKAAKTITTLNHARSGTIRLNKSIITVTTWTQDGPMETRAAGVEATR